MAASKLPFPSLINAKRFGALQGIRIPYPLIPHGGTYHVSFTDPIAWQRCKDTFILKENDILLTSYPKCGHHWSTKICLEIIRANDNGKYTPNLYKTGDIGLYTVPNIEMFASQLSEEQFNERINLTDNIYPRLWFTHHSFDTIPIKTFDPKCKIIAIIRNPKDTIISSTKRYREYILKQLKIHNENMDITISDMISYFIRGIMPYGCYFKWYQSYWMQMKQNNNQYNILWLYYEDMIDFPLENIKKIAKFMYDDKEKISNDGYKQILERTSFKNMKKESIDNPQSYELGERLFRKGTKNDWKKYFNEQQSELIDETMYFKWAQHCYHIKYYQEISNIFNDKYNSGYF